MGVKDSRSEAGRPLRRVMGLGPGWLRAEPRICCWVGWRREEKRAPVIVSDSCVVQESTCHLRPKLAQPLRAPALNFSVPSSSQGWTEHAQGPCPPGAFRSSWQETWGLQRDAFHPGTPFSQKERSRPTCKLRTSINGLYFSIRAYHPSTI